MDELKVILIGLVVLLACSLTMNFLTINSGFSEQYTYNMTAEEKEEFRLSELCPHMQADFTIEILDEFCSERYGGKDYGEAIK